MGQQIHTPGPWSVGEYAPGGDTIVILSDFGAVVRDAGRADSKIAQANARLIAAAPEMLEAIRDALVDLQFSEAPQHKSICDEFRALLAKVEPQPSAKSASIAPCACRSYGTVCIYASAVEPFRCQGLPKQHSNRRDANG